MQYRYRRNDIKRIKHQSFLMRKVGGGYHYISLLMSGMYVSVCLANG